MQYSAERLFLEIATIATKVYATSSVILFCIASLAIANQFDNIRNQVEQNMNLFNDTADILMRLQSQYSSGKKTNMNIFFTVFVFFIISLTINVQFAAQLKSLTTASASSFLSKFLITFSVS